MHMYGLCKGPVCLAEGASERGRVSIDATCCYKVYILHCASNWQGSTRSMGNTNRLSRR
jgi:hypothetical protein